MNLNRFKTVSDIVSVWFGLFALVAGGIFAVVQYLDKEKSERVKNSMELLARFNDKHVVDANTKLVAAWSRHEDALIAVATKVGGTPQEFDDFIVRTMRDEQLFPAFYTMVDFYELVQICISERLCDKATSEALFLHDANRFYTLHFPAIEYVRKNRQDETFAGRLASIAQRKSAK